MAITLTIGVISYDFSDEVTTTLETLKQVPDNCEILLQISHTGGVEPEVFRSAIISRLGNVNLRILMPGDDGIYQAMNKIREAAVGEYVWFLNAGDEMHPDRSLSEIVGLLTSQTCYGFRSEQTYGNDVYLRPSESDVDPAFYRIGHQSTIYHAAAFKNNAFDEQIPVSADVAFSKACFAQIGMCYVPVTLSRFSLGGLSNRCRFSDYPYYQGEGPVLRCKFLAKALLRLLVGPRMMYRILASGKYDRLSADP